MNRAIKIPWGLAALGLLLALGLGWWFFPEGPQDLLLLRGLKIGAAAVEAEDLETALTILSPRYRDERGWTQPIVRRLLRDAFAEFDQFRLDMGTPQIEIDRDKAIVRMAVRLRVTMGGQEGLLVGGQVEPAKLELEFEKAGGQWLLREVRHLSGRPPVL